MNEKVKLCLGLIMVLVGSLVIQDRYWEDKATWMMNFAENQAGAKLRADLYREYEDRLNPSVFNISNDNGLRARAVGSENYTGPWCNHYDPYREYFANEHIVGIIAYDSIFTNCTIDNSTLYHCEIIESNVTNTFIYASLFEYKYGVRYVDCSDGRKSYNITSWWKNP